MTEKIFLFPQMWRRGAESIVWVEMEEIYGPTLVMASDLLLSRPILFEGTPEEYGNYHKMPISKDFYDAFVKESECNHERFKVVKR